MGEGRICFRILSRLTREKTPPRRKRANPIANWMVSAPAGLLVLVSLLGCKEPEKKAAEAPEPKVDGDRVTFASGSPQIASLTVQAAQPRTLAITHLTGRLYWDDEVTVRIFTPVAGRVTGIHADLGDAIQIGSPLADIDSPDFGLALANARTSVGNLAMAEKAFLRSRELLAHGAAAQKDVEAAEAAYGAARAERDRAQAVLANYGGTDKATNSIYGLHSPLAGVLVEKAINPGQEVRADMMLANAPNLFVPPVCRERSRQALAAGGRGGIRSHHSPGGAAIADPFAGISGQGIRGRGQQSRELDGSKHSNGKGPGRGKQP